MNISSVAVVKNALRYIFANFGAIWILLLKAFSVMVVALLLMGSITVGTMGLDSVKQIITKESKVMEQISGSTVVEDSLDQMAGTTGEVIDDGSLEALPDELQEDVDQMRSELTITQILIMSTSGIIILLAMILLMTPIHVNIIHSVMQGTPLETNLFNRFLDKDVLAYIKGYLFLMVSLFVMLSAIAALYTVHPLMSILVIGVVIFALRAVLVPIALATGEATTIGNAWTLTKGNSLNVFKVVLLSGLALLVLHLLVALISLVGGELIAVKILTTIIFIMTMPFQNLSEVALAYVYKHRS